MDLTFYTQSATGVVVVIVVVVVVAVVRHTSYFVTA